jgi:phosphopentomutase
MKFGHRNDVEGYAKALAQFDERLPDIIGGMKEGDIMAICADHGCDPTTVSTDHSREYVPVIIFGQAVKRINLGTIESISDLGATICDYLCGERTVYGESFLDKIIKT